jgi:hypothetical protein
MPARKLAVVASMLFVVGFLLTIAAYAATH